MITILKQVSQRNSAPYQATVFHQQDFETYFQNNYYVIYIEDMLPLSTVESPAFRRLIGGLCCTQVPDRKSFTLYLDRLYDQMVQRVKEALEKAEYVSTTVDVWTAHNRSFLGMTAHWIDPITLERC